VEVGEEEVEVDVDVDVVEVLVGELLVSSILVIGIADDVTSEVVDPEVIPI